MSHKKPRPRDNGGALVEPVRFDAETLAELAQCLGTDVPAALVLDLEHHAAVYRAVEVDTWTPGPTREALRRIKRDAEALAAAVQDEQRRHRKAAALFRTLDATDDDTLDRLRMELARRGCSGLLTELRACSWTEMPSRLLSLEAACEAVREDLPLRGGRPKETLLYLLADGVAEALRRHGVSVAAYYSGHKKQTVFQRVLAVMFRAVGQARGPDAVLRYAKKATSRS